MCFSGKNCEMYIDLDSFLVGFVVSAPVTCFTIFLVEIIFFHKE